MLIPNPPIAHNPPQPPPKPNLPSRTLEPHNRPPPHDRLIPPQPRRTTASPPHQNHSNLSTLLFLIPITNLNTNNNTNPPTPPDPMDPQHPFTTPLPRIHIRKPRLHLGRQPARNVLCPATLRGKELCRETRERRFDIGQFEAWWFEEDWARGVCVVHFRVLSLFVLSLFVLSLFVLFVLSFFVLFILFVFRKRQFVSFSA